jgi:hypothetical protein
MASLTGKTYEYLYRHILSIILFLIVWVIMLVDRLYTVFTGEVNYWLLLGHIIGTCKANNRLINVANSGLI